MTERRDVDPDALLERLSNPLPRPEVEATVRRQCTHGLHPQRCLSRRVRLALCGVLLLFLISILGLLASGRAEWGLWGAALWGTLGWAVVLLTVLVVGVAPKRAHTLWWRRLLLLAVPVAFFLYLAFGGPMLTPLATFFGSGPGVGHAMRCGLLGSVVGAVGTAGVLYIWRGSDPFSPRVTGALIGLLGGIAGALSVGIVCPGQNGWHVLLGHGLSVVALGLLGLLIGRRIIAP